jgi:hypothetical protein
MSLKRKIAWEKFVSNYDSKSEDEINRNIEMEEDLEEDLEEEDSENDMIPHFINLENLVRKKIKTPFGYYEIDDDFSPYNMFDCWIGHTNFKLTSTDFKILDNKIDGIGCLKVLSPYRFFIGIEKMFSFPAVRIQIQKDLCNNLEIEDDIKNVSDPDQTINMVISKINDALFSIKDSEKWAVFVGRDGEVMTIKNSEFESDNEYQNKLFKLKSLKNGNIITYDSL